MRNIWAIILCISIAGPFASGYIFVHFLQSIHQHKTALQLRADRLDHELITLHVSMEEFAALEWEHDHEFEWKGMMYDVKSITANSDGMDILCWKDEKDAGYSELKRSFSERDLPCRSKKESQIPSFKIQLDLPGGGFPLFGDIPADKSAPAYLQLSLIKVALKPPTPPPDHAA